MRRLAVLSLLALLTPAFAYAGGAETSSAGTEEPMTEPAPRIEVEGADETMALAGETTAFVHPTAENFTPVPAKKGPPSEETCPGEFNISRSSSYYDCTLEACNQWCVEEGASYAASHAWFALASGGLCACTCCP